MSGTSAMAWHLAEYYREPRVNHAGRKRSMRNDANVDDLLVHYRYRGNDADDDANRRW